MTVDACNTRPAIQKKYISTKEYIDAFPLAYRQWRADDKEGGKPGCSKLHGYSLTFRFWFETDYLDVRNWAMDYGGLKPLKQELENLFDHVLLVAEDDPEKETLMALQKVGAAKITLVEKTGCEGLADWLYEYINTIFLPNYGKAEAERLWCSRVEVRETAANMAMRCGHREWNEFN